MIGATGTVLGTLVGRPRCVSVLAPTLLHLPCRHRCSPLPQLSSHKMSGCEFSVLSLVVVQIGLALFPMTHLGEDAWKARSCASGRGLRVGPSPRHPRRPVLSLRMLESRAVPPQMNTHTPSLRLPAQMAAAYCSRHIGGAVNYVAVSEYLNITPSIVAGGLAADNLVCALYFAGIFALAGPAASAVAAATGSGGGGGRAAAAAAEPAASAGASTSGGGGVPESSDSDAAAVAAAGGAGAGGEYSAEEKRRGAISVTFGAYALAVAGAICAGSVAAARAMGVAGADIPIITLVVVVMARHPPSASRCFPTTAHFSRGSLSILCLVP